MLSMQEKTDSNTNNTRPNHESPKKRLYLDKRLKKAVVIVLVLILIPVSYAGYIYAVSPVVIRNPKLEHYHFRMQILVDGKAENFAEEKYQKGYVKDQCNANLPEQPIHFHDNKDQFTHIHWEGMTGGMVLKYYGWNYIEGIGGALGYKLDDLKDIQKVTTHGNFLPAIPNDTIPYVYTGDENSYQDKKKIYTEYDDGKNVLRKAMMNFIPEKIINRKKQGFSAPDESWYRGENAEYVKELLLGKNIASAEFINPAYVKKIIEEHIDQKINHRLLLWSLMCFEWWCRIFLKEEKI